MPYNPSTGVYSLPAIYLAIPGTTIIAQQHNDPLVDLQSANNYPRPVIAGGTGAINAAGARANLEVAAADETVTFISPSVDNVVPRWDGVDGAVQDSALTIDDDGNATLVSTDDGSAAGPVADLHRDSASPAANDIIGSRQWTGEDDGGNKTVYAEQRGVILDPADTTEDGKLVTRTVVAGTLADRMHVGAGTWMEGATGGDPGAGKINVVEYQSNGVVIRPITLGTPTNASGSSVNFIDIPAGVKRIVIMLSGISVGGGTNSISVQIGVSGGLETTGYASGMGGSSSQSSTTGFIIGQSTSSSDTFAGSVTLSLMNASTNTWVSGGAIGKPSPNGGFVSGGTKSLAGVLARVSLITDDTFDAGSVNIQYY